MPLIDEISVAIADAMRKHDQGRLSALRMLKAALMNREVEKKRALDEGESRQVVPPSIPLCSSARLPTRLRKPAPHHPKIWAAS
jgi:YqeY-like protein